VDGTESPNFPIDIQGNIKVSAALWDLDRDGDIDIVIPNDNAFFVVDVKRAPQSYEWYCYMGTYNRAGNIYQTTPADDDVTPPAFTELKGNYPNPFNPSTTIRFSLEAPQRVSLEIFNQKGQKVRILLDAVLPAGNHLSVWDGRDDNGSGVSSGIYYYRMRSGKFSSTRKMVMMK
jgi:hypothetical protein